MMRNKIINGCLLAFFLTVSFLGCKKDIPDFDTYLPEERATDGNDSIIGEDYFVLYDTVVNFDTTFIYDSSLLATNRGTDWKVLDSSNVTGLFSADGGDRPVVNLFDGDKATYYHSGYKNNPTITYLPPHWFVVDMNRAQKVGKFFFIGRTGGGPEKQTPELVDIYASNDSASLMSAFDSAATIIVKEQQLPDFDQQQTGDTVWIDNGNAINPLDSFRYFRFQITKNQDDGNVSNFSELGIQLADGKVIRDTIITKDTVRTPIDTIFAR